MRLNLIFHNFFYKNCLILNEESIIKFHIDELKFQLNSSDANSN